MFQDLQAACFKRTDSSTWEMQDRVSFGHCLAIDLISKEMKRN